MTMSGICHFRPRAIACLALCATVTGTLVACSSSGTNTKAASSGSTPSSANDCVATGTAAVKTYRSALKPDFPTGKINISSVTGKTLWFISPTQATGYVAAVTTAFTAAATAAGLKSQIFNGNAKPDLYNQGIEQAIASHAAAIVIYAINPSLVPNALADAKKANIPVFADATGVPTPSDGTIKGTISVDFAEEGTQLANYALMTTGCKVNAAVAFDPNQKALTSQIDAIKAQFAKVCPSTCKVTDLSMSLATMATSLQSQTSSLLLRDQTINIAISTFDSAATYMAPAVATANLKLIATNGLAANLDSVRTGGTQIADVSYPPAEYNGWILVDQLLRAATNQPLTTTTLPLQLFDKENIPATSDFATLWPNVVGYQNKFTTAWGL